MDSYVVADNSLRRTKLNFRFSEKFQMVRPSGCRGDPSRIVIYYFRRGVPPLFFPDDDRRRFYTVYYAQTRSGRFRSANASASTGTLFYFFVFFFFCFSAHASQSRTASARIIFRGGDGFLPAHIAVLRGGPFPGSRRSVGYSAAVSPSQHYSTAYAPLPVPPPPLGSSPTEKYIY